MSLAFVVRPVSLESLFLGHCQGAKAVEYALVFQIASVFDAVVILGIDEALLKYHFILLLAHCNPLSDPIIPDEDTLPFHLIAFPFGDKGIAVLVGDSAGTLKVTIYELTAEVLSFQRVTGAIGQLALAMELIALKESIIGVDRFFRVQGLKWTIVTLGFLSVLQSL